MQWSGVLVPEMCNTSMEAVDVLQFQNNVSNQTQPDNVPGACVTNTATIDVVCGEGGEWGSGD